jgi:hypothetical protein
MKIGAKLIQVDPISSQSKGRTWALGVDVAMVLLS